MNQTEHTNSCPTQNTSKAEVERAAQHYYHSDLQKGIDNRTRKFVIDRVLPYLRGDRVLDLGYIDGLWTDALLTRGLSVDIVEGAQTHSEHARDRYRGNPRVRVHHSLFQEFVPDRHYPTVIAGDVLRYIPEPVAFLEHVKNWLTNDGCLIATVPNSRSLHRRIGALLGMEQTPVQANERDREVGNLRQYDRYEFRALLSAAGYHIQLLQGCFLKPLSSQQMKDWDETLLQAFADVGDELQDYCWFLYAICSLG